MRRNSEDGEGDSSSQDVDIDDIIDSNEEEEEGEGYESDVSLDNEVSKKIRETCHEKIRQFLLFCFDILWLLISMIKPVFSP